MVFFLIISGIGIFLYFLYLQIIFVVTCLIGALSCRFIVRVLGFFIMGLILNADIASPYVTFFYVASRNVYLCYYNLQKKYQEVKQMISQQWKKQKHLLRNKNLPNSEEGTIPEDLFWHICGQKSKPEHKVLPIRPEIFRMLRNMALILIFLFLALCSIIFFGHTYNISAVVSTIAVFVSGKIPGLFFKSLTKEKTFKGATKIRMMTKIEEAVKDYIKIRNKRTSVQANKRTRPVLRFVLTEDGRMQARWNQ